MNETKKINKNIAMLTKRNETVEINEDPFATYSEVTNRKSEMKKSDFDMNK